MICEKRSYVAGDMCDSKLKLSILAADGIVENAVTELMGDLGIDGIVAMERYKAMWLIVKNNIRTNNIEYVRFMLNTYDSEFFKAHDPEGLEIHYLSQSFEGEKLDIEQLKEEDGDLFRIRRDGSEITSCRLSWHDAEKPDLVPTFAI